MRKITVSLALLLFCIIFAPTDGFVGACDGTPSRSRLSRVRLGAEAFRVAKRQRAMSKNNGTQAAIPTYFWQIMPELQKWMEDEFHTLRVGYGSYGETWSFRRQVMSISMVRGGITRNHKGSMPILHRALEGYLGNLEKRPLLTKGISSGIIAGIGNFMQQSLSDVAFSLTDWTAFTLVGAVYIGTLLHLWFNVLDRFAHSNVVRSRVRTKWGRSMLQMGMDVTFGTAMINTGVFVINTILIAAMTGRLSPLPDLWSAVKLKVSSNFYPMMIENFKIWPWVSFLNFTYVPVKFRVLVTNCVAVFWSYLLSQWCG